MEFSDVMPEELHEKLPKELPSCKDVDHAIELVLREKPLARAPYRTTIPELQELRRQFKELLDAGFIRPSKAPFGAPVLFQKKHNGSL